MVQNSSTPGDGTQALALRELEKGMPGITSEFGECLAQAASICLEEQNHRSGVQFNVDGDFNRVFVVLWETATEQMRRCWADPEVATEHGAYGIAALLVVELADLTVLERSRKGTGFDYWLGSKSAAEPLFQNKVRLEVSGIRNGDESAIKSRVKLKVEQTRRSEGILPAYVIVVEFGGPRSRAVLV